MNTPPITQRSRLPLGFTADFIWRDGHTTIEWSPSLPNIRSGRHRRKLFAAYAEARAEFFQLVASVTGKRICTIDLEGGDVRLSDVIAPPTRN